MALYMLFYGYIHFLELHILCLMNREGTEGVSTVACPVECGSGACVLCLPWYAVSFFSPLSFYIFRFYHVWYSILDVAVGNGVVRTPHHVLQMDVDEVNMRHTCV